MMQLLKILFHILIVVLTFLLAAWSFRAVAPQELAYAIAVVIVIAEIAVWLFTGKHGGGTWMLIKLAVPLIVFPGAAWLAGHLFGWPWYYNVPIAAAVACASGALAARHGAGHESRRLAEVGIATIIPLYTLAYLTAAGAPWTGLACAVAAMAVAPFVLRIAVAWPRSHERLLSIAGGLCAVWAVMIAGLALVGLM